jgi:hypothetical protein
MFCVCSCSLNYPARNALPYCHLWPVWLYHIFPHYLINGTILGKKKLPNIKCAFWFSLQLLFETFLILRRIQRDIVTNVRSLRVKYTLFLSDYNENWIFSTDIRKIARMLNVIRIRPVRSELFLADRQTDVTKLIVVFSQFCERI